MGNLKIHQKHCNEQFLFFFNFRNLFVYSLNKFFDEFIKNFDINVYVFGNL